MPERSPMLLRVLFCLLFLSAFPVQAQLEPQYRIELLVFSNPAGGGAEQWEATPDLAYPRSTQFLLNTEPPAAATPAATLTPQPTQTTAATATTSLAPPPPSSTAFVMLPVSQRELSAGAAALQRSGRYRILFHEAWTQPMTGQAAALPIVLDQSGDGGHWPALQGTIKVYQAGAFFLDTNLWLNTSGDYLPGTWRMPPPPRAPANQVIEAPGRMETQLPNAVPSQPDAMPATANLQQPASAAPDYPYRHAVLLKQSRKMRSGQLNYLDHPLLGVLVKITPLATPEPSTP